MNFRERVRNGIKFLNSKYGRVWRKKVDLDSLDLRISCNCVLGQLEGSYTAGVNKWNLSTPGAEGFGFGFFLEDASYEQWNRLTDTWKREITR